MTPSDRDNFYALLREARYREAQLTPEQRRKLTREQKISWVYGEHCLQHETPTLTREDVARIVDEHEARDEDAPYVCPGCHTVGGGPCAPGCIDDAIAREREDEQLYGHGRDDDDDSEDSE